MLEIMKDVAFNVFGKKPQLDRLINTHHNFCQCERCVFVDPKTGLQVEEDLWVTRKGATGAREGQAGLIPGSMGTGSYVVEGKGMKEAWSSCSHGAGRVMSRTKAFQMVKQHEFEATLKGIACDSDEGLRDEAPQAYKDLEEVMAHQV